MKISGYGLELDLPEGWEGRIFRAGQAPPVTHVGSFPLGDSTSTFGSGLLENLPPGGVFMALVQYIPDDVVRPGEGRYAPSGFPRGPFTAKDFDPLVLQVGWPGHAGIQRFFSVEKRPFCLFLVTNLGYTDPLAPGSDQLPALSDVLQSVVVDPNFVPPMPAVTP